MSGKRRQLALDRSGVTPGALQTRIGVRHPTKLLVMLSAGFAFVLVDWHFLLILASQRGKFMRPLWIGYIGEKTARTMHLAERL